MADQIDPTDAAVVVSCDSHVGPLLREQLRDYCPSEHLEEFDAYVVEQEQAATALRDSIGRERPAAIAEHPNLAVPGHHDAAARLADMDADGVAAEVIWHFSQNGENMPWVGQGLGTVHEAPVRDRQGRLPHLQRVARRLLPVGTRAPARAHVPADVGHRRRHRGAASGAARRGCAG